MTARDAPQALSEEQRDALVNQLARDWEVVHGHGPGCLTGFMMMSDRELIDEVQAYRAKAIAVVGDDR